MERSFDMTNAPLLSVAELQRLQEFSTPTLSNAIETFGVRPRSEGYMNASIRCLQPVCKPMVGYSVTGRFRCAERPAPGQGASRSEYWKWLSSIPEPRVVVLQDVDEPPGVGSFWGEIQATIHLALGCVGTVTNGGVRDLEEVQALGFYYFAAHVAVSHAYVHLVNFGTPVEVGGVTVHPGQLIHADPHGVLLIPDEVSPYLAEVAEAYEAVEQEFVRKVRASGFSPDRLKTEYESFAARRSALRPPPGFRAGR
jgi:4-hydroxy-4-methyl-2-oxoglutarate aldolase